MEEEGTSWGLGRFKRMKGKQNRGNVVFFTYVVCSKI